MILVTVYITNHNYEKYLDQSIKSVLNQTYQDFELIIIDDGSTDNSSEIIEKYRSDSKVIIVYQENKGLNTSNNIAIRLSRGKYVMRLDADDYLDENALSIMVERLENGDKLDFVFPDYYIIDENGELIKQFRRHNFDNVTLLDQPAHGACTMIKKDVLIEIGGYSEDISCQDGYEFWVKSLNKYKFKNINLPLFYYRQHNRSLTKNIEKILTTRHKIIKRNAEKNNIQNKNHICILPIRETMNEEPLAIRKFCNTTLLDLTIKQINESENIKYCFIATEDKKILNYLSNIKLNNFNIIKRPKSLGNYNVRIEKTIDFIFDKHMDIKNVDTITIVNYEYPFRKSIYIDKAINTLFLFDADTVIAVKTIDSNCYYHKGHGLKLFKTNVELSLERESIYCDEGGIHSIKADSYKKFHKVITDRISHIVLDELSSKCVKSELDFEIFEFIYDKKIKKGVKSE